MGFQPVQSDVREPLQRALPSNAATGQAGSPSHSDSLEGYPTTAAPHDFRHFAVGRPAWKRCRPSPAAVKMS